MNSSREVFLQRINNAFGFFSQKCENNKTTFLPNFYSLLCDQPNVQTITIVVRCRRRGGPVRGAGDSNVCGVLAGTVVGEAGQQKTSLFPKFVSTYNGSVKSLRSSLANK
uniref:Uncharacterized protein n=1 Tax=Glossina austeni TaxID=7395 RepID=A0A1A9VKQ9_GLOAU